MKDARGPDQAAGQTYTENGKRQIVCVVGHSPGAVGLDYKIAEANIDLRF
jgi:hypothetical protein